MSRQYLYVPHEERPDVQARGAHWDPHSRRWYLTARHDPAHFKRWLSPDGGEPPGSPAFCIESYEACVACAETRCQQCGAPTPVIALYCSDGHCDGEPLEDFSIINITAMNETLSRQLTAWPFFRQALGFYRNHCLTCLAPQEDEGLHCEPEGAFFYMDLEARVSMTLTPLSGCIRVSGEETFEL